VSKNSNKFNIVNTIIFDFDGTLRHDRPEASELVAQFIRDKGVQVSPETNRRARRWEHYYWGQSPELALDKEKFGEMENLFWNNYLVRNLIAFDCSTESAQELAPQAALHMKEAYQPEDWVPPETLPTLQTLRSNGYQVGLLSNRQSPCDDRLEELGLDGCFDLVLVAGEVDAWKPDPGIFHEALRRLDATPSQTAHIGDNFYTDVIGAQNAGMHPILYDPGGVFPEAECPVLQSLEGVLDILNL